MLLLALMLAHLGSSSALSEADSCAQTSRGVPTTSRAESAVARASCGRLLAAQLSIRQQLGRNSASVRNRIGLEAARPVRAAAAAVGGRSAQRCGRDE